MKKQMTLLFLLLSIVSCNVNAAHARKGGPPKPPTAPHKTNKPMVSGARFNSLFSRWEDKNTQFQKLQEELNTLKQNKQDTRDCDERLEICADERNQIRRDLEVCSDEVESLRKELEGDDRIPGLRELYNGLHTEVEGTDTDPGLRALAESHDRLKDEVEGADGLRARANRARQLESELQHRKSNYSDPVAPYAVATALAGGSTYVLHKVRGDSKALHLLGDATLDALKLGVVSSGAAAHGGSHTFLNGFKLKSGDSAFASGGKIFMADTTASGILRLLEEQVSKSNNGIVRMVKKLPAPVQECAHLLLAQTVALGLHNRSNPWKNITGK